MIAAALAIALAGLSPTPTDLPLTALTPDGTRLESTLTLPPGPGPHRLAVIVSGFGPSARDGAGGLYRTLSDDLVARGVATLRYDKRGTGASQGTVLAWLNGERLAADLISVTRRAAGHAHIDPDRVILVGHSQGGMLSLRAGRELPVAGVVTLAAPGRPLEQIPGAAGPSRRLLPAIVGPAAARATLQRDPRADARRLDVPLLLVHGDRDGIVAPGDLRRLAGARRDSAASTRTLLVPGMGHQLRRRGGALPAELLSEIVAFPRA